MNCFYFFQRTISTAATFSDHLQKQRAPRGSPNNNALDGSYWTEKTTRLSTGEQPKTAERVEQTQTKPVEREKKGSLLQTFLCEERFIRELITTTTLPCGACASDRHQSLWRLQNLERVGCCVQITLICARGQHEHVWQSSEEYPDRSLAVNRLVPSILYRTGMAQEDACVMLKSLGMKVDEDKYRETVSWSRKFILEEAQLKMTEHREKFVDFMKTQKASQRKKFLANIAIGVDIQYNRSHREEDRQPFSTCDRLLWRRSR
jgi:hypothetical protein